MKKKYETANGDGVELKKKCRKKNGTFFSTKNGHRSRRQIRFVFFRPTSKVFDSFSTIIPQQKKNKKEMMTSLLLLMKSLGIALALVIKATPT